MVSVSDQPMLEVLGAPGSPYTRKMLALLRFRRIPYAVHWGNHMNPPAGYPAPKVKLLPTLYFPAADGGREAAVDSTLLIQRLEKAYAGRAVLPEHPVLRFLCDLLEDYADEWLTKAMFHYRWAHEEDRKNAGPLLVFWNSVALDSDNAAAMSEAFTQRQFDRLHVVGSNEQTGQIIESSYQRFVKILDQLLEKRGFVLGARPCAADFAIYGQLTQLAIVEPTSARLTRATSARVRAWLDVVEDLSGVAAGDEGWFTPQEAIVALTPLLGEIGRVYLPFLAANAAALQAGKDRLDALIDESPWTQPVFPYQAKCLAVLRDSYAALGPESKLILDPALRASGCSDLLDEG